MIFNSWKIFVSIIKQRNFVYSSYEGDSRERDRSSRNIASTRWSFEAQMKRRLRDSRVKRKFALECALLQSNVAFVLARLSDLDLANVAYVIKVCVLFLSVFPAPSILLCTFVWSRVYVCVSYVFFLF